MECVTSEMQERCKRDASEMQSVSGSRGSGAARLTLNGEQGQHKKMAERRRRQKSRVLYREIEELLRLAGGQSRVALLQALLCRLLPPSAQGAQAAGLPSMPAMAVQENQPGADLPGADQPGAEKRLGAVARESGAVPCQNHRGQARKSMADADRAHVQGADAHATDADAGVGAARHMGLVPGRKGRMAGDSEGQAGVQGCVVSVCVASVASVASVSCVRGRAGEAPSAGNKRMLRERRARLLVRSMLAALVSPPVSFLFSSCRLPFLSLLARLLLCFQHVCANALF